MHVNNETGVIQPLDEICVLLENHEAYFHVDAAQGFGKELTLLSNRRIDLVSISGHKIYAPKGIGALVTRRRESKQIPLRPQIFGGGQERGLRAGTLPVPLIVGLGTAAEIALPEHTSRIARNEEIRLKALNAFSSVSDSQWRSYAFYIVYVECLYTGSRFRSRDARTKGCCRYF